MASSGTLSASKYFRERFDPDDLAEIVSSVQEATQYDDPTEIDPLLRDPDDDYLVALARMQKQMRSSLATETYSITLA